MSTVHVQGRCPACHHDSLDDLPPAFLRGRYPKAAVPRSRQSSGVS